MCYKFLFKFPKLAQTNFFSWPECSGGQSSTFSMLLDYIDQAQGVGQCRPLNVDHKNVIKSVMAYNPASTQGEVNLLAAYRPPSTRYPDGVPAENMKRDDITTDMLANSDDGTLRWYIFGHQHSFQARSELRSEQPTIEEFKGLVKCELWVGLTPEEMRKVFFSLSF